MFVSDLEDQTLWYIYIIAQAIIGTGRFAMVQHYEPPCTRSGFGLGCMAEIWFLGKAGHPIFAVLKQLELISVVT